MSQSRRARRNGQREAARDQQLVERAIAEVKAEAAQQLEAAAERIAALQRELAAIQQAFGQKIQQLVVERANAQSLLAMLVEDRGGHAVVLMSRLRRTERMANAGEAIRMTTRVHRDRVELWYPGEAPPVDCPFEAEACGHV